MTVIKHYWWSKASRQLQATPNGTYEQNQNTNLLCQLSFGVMKQSQNEDVPSLIFVPLFAVSTQQGLIRQNKVNQYHQIITYDNKT